MRSRPKDTPRPDYVVIDPFEQRESLRFCERHGVLEGYRVNDGPWRCAAGGCLDTRQATRDDVVVKA